MADFLRHLNDELSVMGISFSDPDMSDARGWDWGSGSLTWDQDVSSR